MQSTERVNDRIAAWEKATFFPCAHELPVRSCRPRPVCLADSRQPSQRLPRVKDMTLWGLALKVLMVKPKIILRF
jgi:hypothetical protein